MIDLHTHSTASDGSERPAAVVRRAADRGLRALALTDHDTQAGLAEATAEAARQGLEFVPGIELSVEWGQGAMHLIVLFLLPAPGPLQDRLAGLRHGRNARNELIIEKLAALGLPVDPADVLELGRGESVGRPHIAAVMVQRGYAGSIAEAFEHFLGRGMPAYVPRPRLAPDEAIRLAVSSGATPVLAHPHTLGLNTADEVAATLGRLAAAGLVGMECHYPLYTPLEREGYVALAQRFGLHPSGGSDYHGTYKPGVEVGTGRGDLSVPDRFLDPLRPAR